MSFQRILKRKGSLWIPWCFYSLASAFGLVWRVCFEKFLLAKGWGGGAWLALQWHPEAESVACALGSHWGERVVQRGFLFWELCQMRLWRTKAWLSSSSCLKTGLQAPIRIFSQKWALNSFSEILTWRCISFFCFCQEMVLEFSPIVSKPQWLIVVMIRIHELFHCSVEGVFSSLFFVYPLKSRVCLRSL